MDTCGLLSPLGIHRISAGQGQLDGGRGTHIIGPHSLRANLHRDQQVVQYPTHCGQWGSTTHRINPFCLGDAFHLLDSFREEGGKGKAFRHVPTRTLLLLLVEAQVRPGKEHAAENQPEERVGDDVEEGKQERHHTEEPGEVLQGGRSKSTSGRNATNGHGTCFSCP